MNNKLKLFQKKNETAFNAFNEVFKTGVSKKGDVLVSPGTVCKNLYILNSGITKQFRNKADGTQHIIWFNFNGDLVTALRSFIREEVTNEGVEVMEDCAYIFISRENCYRLTEKYHEVETFFRELMEIYLIESEERMFFLQALSAKEKYAYLEKNLPHFMQKLPQKELASFLGITRETFSRMRKYS